MTDDENVVDGLSILETSRSRWLNVTEIITLLTLWTSPLSLSSSPPKDPPPSGTLLLYDQSVMRNYTNDGCDWIRRRKGHVKLRVGGQYRVAGCYVQSTTTPTFHRRAYHIHVGAMREEIRERKHSLILLHYLDTEEALVVSDRFSDRLASTVGRGGAGGRRSGRRGGRKAAGLRGRKAGCGGARGTLLRTLMASQKAAAAARQLQEQAMAVIAATTELQEQCNELEPPLSSTTPPPGPECGSDAGQSEEMKSPEDEGEGNGPSASMVAAIVGSSRPLACDDDNSTLGTLWDMVVEDEGYMDPPTTGIHHNLTLRVEDVIEQVIRHRRRETTRVRDI